MWILPTYSRPKQCAEVLRNMMDNGCGSPGKVLVNGSGFYKEYMDTLSIPRDWSIISSAENKGVLGALNFLFKEFPEEPWYGFIADDEFVSTPVFDKRLIEAAGDWGISHGNIGPDARGEYGKRAQGFLCIGGKLARAVGYLAIQECWHWRGLDDFWERMAEARACEKIYCEDVIIEHRHPYLDKKIPHDECNKLSEGRINEDTDAYVKWLWSPDGCAAAINRIKEAKIHDASVQSSST